MNTWFTTEKNEDGEVIARCTHRTYVTAQGVFVYESEEWQLEDEGEPAPEVAPTTGRFGIKSVDGLGATNLNKISTLKVTGSEYVAVLTNGTTLTAHGIADFAKQLRKV